MEDFIKVKQESELYLLTLCLSCAIGWLILHFGGRYEKPGTKRDIQHDRRDGVESKRRREEPGGEDSNELADERNISEE